MDLNNALKQFEAVEANLAKLDQLWGAMKRLLPAIDEVQVGDQDQFLQMQRCFEQIAKQMPKIDGFELQVCLEHPDDIFRFKIDSLESGELTDRAALDAHLY